MTGASAVCAVVYVLPVAIHLKLFFRRCDGNGSPGSSGCLGWLGAKAPRRRSFSFDLAAAQPGAEGEAAAAVAAAETRWLLAHDQLGSGGDGGLEGGAPPMQAGAAPVAQQAAGHQPSIAQLLALAAQAAQDEEEGNGAGPAAVVPVMRGHRSDLSLNRWVRAGVWL